MRRLALALLIGAASAASISAQTLLTDPLQQKPYWDFVAQPDAGIDTPGDMAALTGRFYINGEQPVVATGITCDPATCQIPWPLILSTRLTVPNLVWSLQLTLANTKGESLKSAALLLQTPPPGPQLQPCTYIAPGSAVMETRPIGTVLHGVNQIATQGARWMLFLRWGWQLLGDPISVTTVDMIITCKGLPLPAGV